MLAKEVKITKISKISPRYIITENARREVRGRKLRGVSGSVCPSAASGISREAPKVAHYRILIICNKTKNNNQTSTNKQTIAK